MAVQGVRQLETIPAGEGDGQGGELIARMNRMKQCHASLPFLALVTGARSIQ